MERKQILIQTLCFSQLKIMITDNDSAALGYCCSSTTPGTDGAFCGLYIYPHPRNILKIMALNVENN